MPRLSRIGAASASAFGFAAKNSYLADYVLVAGGGAGSGAGADSAGGQGGGAGGMLNSTATLITGSTYTFVIGAGGTAQFQGFNVNGNLSLIHI